jgi:nitrile hydratase subunit beta
MNPRFAVGAQVNVRRGNPPGHIRTPYYIRGKAGTVERICGEFRNPEELAYGRTGEPKQVLNRVRFAQKDIWPAYAGPDKDTIDVELYEHWLEPAQ